MTSKSQWIKGKTVQNILDMPFNELNKFTDSELKVVVGRLVSAGNKRIRRYQTKKGDLPKAGKQGTYEERKFSTQGKNRTELFEEFKRAKNFFNAESSSLRGEQKIKSKSQTALKDNFGIDVSDSDYDLYWKAFDRLKELHPEVDERNYKYIVLSHMDKMIEQRKGKPYKSYKTFARAIEKKLDELYKENQRIANADGTSGFFEV